MEEVVRRVRAEFLESPGLRLTPRQAQRFWSLDPDTCMALFDALVSSRFLERTASGQYGTADPR
jgi:hypothetical protein